MPNEQREKFEKWLRTVCFQKPTPEAYDLAWQAWQAAEQSVHPTDATVAPSKVESTTRNSG